MSFLTEWLSYSANDFLLFSERVYWRLFVLENRALWPLPLLTGAAALLAIGAVLRGGRGTGLAIRTGLALAWAWLAWHFLPLRYEPVNWAIGHAVPAFWLQALLLALIPWQAGSAARAGRWAGLGLAAAGALLWPAFAWLAGRDPAAAEVAGIAPDPTAVVTLGLLATAAGRRAWLPALLPVLWLCYSAAALLTMGSPQGWATLGAAVAGVVALVLGRGGRAR